MQLDHANIAKAIDFLGIKFPVEVRVEHINEWTMGLHYTRVEHPAIVHFMKDGVEITRGGAFVSASEARWTHIIQIDPDLSPRDAGETIWHELVHAMQHERDVPLAGTVAEAFISWRVLGTTYADANEAEANSYMHHNRELSLAF